MSRKRLRAGVIAGSTVPCPHCVGQGIIRSVESTALRVLRALEEEGQRMKASAVLVRVASDVAIYTLNQKRKELARIEGDYGMEIGFEPKEGLPAGTFDIERTAQKSPEERAKHAVSVEAGFVATSQPLGLTEPDDDAIEAEIEEEENQEDEEILAPQPEPSEREPLNRNEGGGGRRRRRRRRGGRARDRQHGERGWNGPRDQQNAAGQAPRPTLDADQKLEHQSSEDAVDAGIPDASLRVQQHSAGQQGEGGGRRRRRRRRRGRRCQGNAQAMPQRDFATQPASTEHDEWNDRFGPADEVDTTPRDELVSPNASSAPEWSLDNDRPSEPPTLREHIEPAPSAETKHVEPVHSKTTEQKPSESQEPAKKGWWQRAFRSE